MYEPSASTPYQLRMQMGEEERTSVRAHHAAPHRDLRELVAEAPARKDLGHVWRNAQPACGPRLVLARLLEHGDAVACAGERERAREAGDARADNGEVDGEVRAGGLSDRHAGVGECGLLAGILLTTWCCSKLQLMFMGAQSCTAERGEAADACRRPSLSMLTILMSASRRACSHVHNVTGQAAETHKTQRGGSERRHEAVVAAPPDGDLHLDAVRGYAYRCAELYLLGDDQHVTTSLY
jgi:hypothetical protein